MELTLTWKDRCAHQNGPLAAADDDFEAKPAEIQFLEIKGILVRKENTPPELINKASVGLP